MSSRFEVAVLSGNLASHPAVAAWRELAHDAPDPERIEVLEQRSKSATYRLVGVGSDGRSIIAQRSRLAKAQIERTVYEQILPHVPVAVPRYYGYRVDDASFAWLFLEDVGDEPYSATDPAHLALAARWVGAMHTSGADVPAAQRLPEGGPARYLDHLRTGRDAVQAGVANPILTADARTALRQLLPDLDRLEREWASIERVCADVPATLVHGDFRPKNARIRNHASQPELLALDWEMAGWGVPAIDLVEVDIPTYWSVTQSRWLDMPLDDLRRLQSVGRVFRWLAAIRWRAPQLLYERADWLITPVMVMEIARRTLIDALEALGVAR